MSAGNLVSSKNAVSVALKCMAIVVDRYFLGAGLFCSVPLSVCECT